MVQVVPLQYSAKHAGNSVKLNKIADGGRKLTFSAHTKIQVNLEENR